MNYREELQKAIEAMHGSNSEWLESVPVREMFRGEIAWEGLVEVFKLTEHPKAKKCYAWGAKDDAGHLDITAVLELPPVTSPQTAVKVAIAAKARSGI